MKIFSKAQIYEGDKITIQKQNISSADLMERAGLAIFNWIDSRMQGAPVPIHVFCGIGNNGGDGLVVARHLVNHGYHVKTYIVDFSEKRSKDFLINYERLKQYTKDWPVSIKSKDDFPEIGLNDIVVDAIFGVGLNRPIASWIVALFAHLKASKALTISIDIPSGLFTDKLSEDESQVLHANLILSFQTPKLVFFLPDTAKYIEQWEVLDIGIDPEYIQATETEAYVIGKHEVLQWYKPRTKFSHKGLFGHVLLIGGSYGKIGAVQLAARAALTSGSGLVTAYVPECGYLPFQTAFPEAMILTDTNETHITDIRFTTDFSAIGIGMGLGVAQETIVAFEAFLKTNTKPLVIDADGLNILALQPKLLEHLVKDSILTPHPKELERLIGAWDDDFDKLTKAKAFAEKHQIVFVIKGANTTTVYNDKLYINVTGNPGLATAGTGDVLTGIITGLLGQGYNPLQAACFGVYLHGKSADVVVEQLGYQSMIASDVINGIGAAYIELLTPPEVQQQPANPENNK